MFKEDPVLNQITTKFQLEDIKSTNNVFHDLVGIIIEQQIHYRSSKKVFEKMLTQADISELNIKNFEHFEKLGLGKQTLSMSKYEALMGVCDFFEKNSLKWNTMSDQEIRNTLTKLKGVSDWSVDMILIYTLQRADIFPSKDYHLGKILNHLFPEQAPLTPGKIKKMSVKWAPHRSLAMRYFLAAKNN